MSGPTVRIGEHIVTGRWVVGWGDAHRHDIAAFELIVDGASVKCDRNGRILGAFNHPTLSHQQIYGLARDALGDDAFRAGLLDSGRQELGMHRDGPEWSAAGLPLVRGQLGDIHTGILLEADAARARGLRVVINGREAEINMGMDLGRHVTASSIQIVFAEGDTISVFNNLDAQGRLTPGAVEISGVSPAASPHYTQAEAAAIAIAALRDDHAVGAFALRIGLNEEEAQAYRLSAARFATQLSEGTGATDAPVPGQPFQPPISHRHHILTPG